MRVLIIGSGAREQAIGWAAQQSGAVESLAYLPGNGGTAPPAVNLPGDPLDLPAVAAAAAGFDLIIVGPEAPLSAGIVDALQARGHRCLGPTQAAARLESSKAWAKAFMQRHAIPTAPARLVDAATLDAAVAALRAPGQRYPVAVKADGLAAGKGVVIAHNAAAAEAALRDMIAGGRFGAAGAQVLIEEFLEGREVSVFAIADGQTYRLLGTACDHKRAFDGDRGPNTGGMGAYAPAGWLDAATLTAIDRLIIAPTIAGMAAEGCSFAGFLFAGLMITAAGPRVIEFNARLGDPETQVILPLLATPFADLCRAAADGRLAEAPPLSFRAGAACGVVVAAGGYPDTNVHGAPIAGLEALDPDVLVFHGGTQRQPDGTLTADGGRILTVVGLGADLVAARARAYANVGRAQFAGARFRSDIGA